MRLFSTCSILVLLSPPASGLTITPKGDPSEDNSTEIPKIIGEIDVIIDKNLHKDEIEVHLLSTEEKLNFTGVLINENTWYGELHEDQGWGTANFLLGDDDRLTGSVSLEDYICHISKKVDGRYLVECIQQSDFPLELDPVDLPTEPDYDGSEITDAIETQHQDIMVVYTHDAMCGEAGLAAGCEITDENTAPIEARIQLAIEETNAAYNMSKMTAGTVRLVHTYLNSEYAEVSQDDNFTASNNYQQMLDDVSTPGDGKLEEVFDLRDEYGADIVNLWVEVSGYCGMAWGSCTNQFCDCEYPYAVMKRTCTTGYWTFGHENGHCQGNQHDRANDSSMRKSAYGWQDPDQRFRSIMAYDCDDQTCGKVQRFSTPNVTWYGEAIGDVDNDNVRQMALSWNTLSTCRPVAKSDEGTTPTSDAAGDENQICGTAKAGYQACLGSELCDDTPDCTAECSTENSCCAPCASQGLVYQDACCAENAADVPVVDFCESSTAAFTACLSSELCPNESSCSASCDLDSSCCVACVGAEAVYKEACCDGDAAQDEGTEGTTSDAASLKTKAVVAALLCAAALV